jgi:hypothetical protein
MDMHEKDEQLLRSFCDERCLKDVTYESYATAIGCIQDTIRNHSTSC